MMEVSVPTILYLKKIIICTTNGLILLLLLLNLCELIRTDNHSDYDKVDDQARNNNNSKLIMDNLKPPPPSPRHVKTRQKRFVWMKNRKLIFPTGSILTITPELQIPFLRQPPEGLNSDMKISWAFYMFFDKLGMTDESHPWPPLWSWPSIDPFSSLFRLMRRQSMASGKTKGRFERSVMGLPPPDRIHGGERAIMIPQLEKMLRSMGIDDSRACLLRAICEIHELPLHHQGFGLLGEILTLIFTMSLSPYAESHLTEYVKAEEAGRAGDCGQYIRKCGKSMFVCNEEKNRYSKEMQNSRHSKYSS